jgi:hypothetical protein
LIDRQQVTSSRTRFFVADTGLIAALPLSLSAGPQRKS